MATGTRLAGFVVCATLFLTPLAFATPAAAQANGASAKDTPRSVMAGVYTNDQAKAGESLFQQSCGNCHPTSQFAGTPFQRMWHDKPVFAFFDQVRLMMPMDNPGGMTNEQYAAVVAYILKLNAYPAGDTKLPDSDAALKLIRFEQKTGSQ